MIIDLSVRTNPNSVVTVENDRDILPEGIHLGLAEDTLLKEDSTLLGVDTEEPQEVGQYQLDTVLFQMLHRGMLQEEVHMGQVLDRGFAQDMVLILGTAPVLEILRVEVSSQGNIQAVARLGRLLVVAEVRAVALSGYDS